MPFDIQAYKQLNNIGVNYNGLLSLAKVRNISDTYLPRLPYAQDDDDVSSAATAKS